MYNLSYNIFFIMTSIYESDFQRKQIHYHIIKKEKQSIKDYPTKLCFLYSNLNAWLFFIVVNE